MHIEQVEPRRLLAAVGPDGFGYVADPHPFENINLPVGEFTEFNFPGLGDNTFNFYGRQYSQMNVGLGFIGFGSAVTRDDNSDLAGSPFPRMLAALWDSWTTRRGTLQQVNHRFDNTGGDARPDRLILQWNLTDQAVPTAERKPVVVQAILQLNTGDAPGEIIFNYVTLDTNSPKSNGASATVGLKDFGYRSNRLLISFNDANNPLVGSGKAIRIYAASTGQPRANAGGGGAKDEGTEPLQVPLNALGSTDANQPASSLNYAWDFDLDGVYGETAPNSFGDERGATPTYVRPSVGLDGDKSFPIALRVIDSSGLVSYDEATVRVNNVKPSAPTVTGPTSVAAGEVFTFQLTATDPGNDLYGFEVDWGDQTQQGRAEPNGVISHAYLQPGTYNLRIYAFDTNGGSGGTEVTRTMTVSARPDVLLNSLGTLLVTTGGGDDMISITLTGGQLRLDRNGTVTTYSPASVEDIDIDAGAGNNTITSSVDIDTTLRAGAGHDSITLGDGESNHVHAGEGNNTIAGGSGSEHVTAGTGNDVVTDPGGYSNGFELGDGNNHITIAHAYVKTGAGNDTVIGTEAGEFHLYVGDGDNVIDVDTSGPFGHIEAGNGDDSIATGARDDFIISGDGADTISAGDGNDRISAGGAIGGGDAARIDAGAGNDDVTVKSAVSIAGGDGNDRITAMQWVGSIDAGAGDDLVRAHSDATHPAVVFGGDGNDNLFTADGRDSIYGGAGRDTVHAGLGSDLISGGGSADLLFGQGGKDRIYGGNGNDRLHGQSGNDDLIGQAGADTIDGGRNTDVADDDPLDELIGVEGTL